MTEYDFPTLQPLSMRLMIALSSLQDRVHGCRRHDVDLIEDDGSTILIEIVTSVGTLQIIGACEPFDRHLVMDRAHVQGLSPGALGRQGLNETARKIMEWADVDTIAIHGAVRSTGRHIGRPPRPFFSRR